MGRSLGLADARSRLARNRDPRTEPRDGRPITCPLSHLCTSSRVGSMHVNILNTCEQHTIDTVLWLSAQHMVMHSVSIRRGEFIRALPHTVTCPHSATRRSTDRGREHRQSPYPMAVTTLEECAIGDHWRARWGMPPDVVEGAASGLVDVGLVSLLVGLLL